MTKTSGIPNFQNLMSFGCYLAIIAGFSQVKCLY